MKNQALEETQIDKPCLNGLVECRNDNLTHVSMNAYNFDRLTEIILMFTLAEMYILKSVLTSVSINYALTSTNLLLNC